MAACDSRTKLRIGFNQKKPPDLNAVRSAFERILAQGPCTRCGLDGIDVLLRLEEIVEPDPTPWVATVDGGGFLAG